MEKIIDYMVIRKEFYPALEAEVKKKIFEGWQPIGGMCFVGFPMSVFAQSMVKYE